MRQLSLSIGASDSYIQKLLTDQASPSLKKVDALGSFFGLDTWTLFCDFDEAAGDSLEILQLINRLPQSVRPNVMEYIKFLLKQYEEVLQKMNNENQ